MALDEGDDTITVGNIELGEDKPRIGAQYGQARLLQLHVIVIIEIVDTHDAIATLE